MAILDTVHRSRTTAVIPAAVRVTSAQRRTRRRLFWVRRSGYLTLNSRAIPGTNCIIDHLVVGPAGVFAVDSERWDRRLPLRATQGGHLYHGPYSQTGRLKHAQLEAGLAGQLISEALGRKQRIRPAMVIYGPTVPWTVARISGVDVFSGRRLRKYLRAQARARREQRLTREEIERIHAAADKALPPREVGGRPGGPLRSWPARWDRAAGHAAGSLRPALEGSRSCHRFGPGRSPTAGTWSGHAR